MIIKEDLALLGIGLRSINIFFKNHNFIFLIKNYKIYKIIKVKNYIINTFY